jgi:hypothetical protein
MKIVGPRSEFEQQQNGKISEGGSPASFLQMFSRRRTHWRVQKDDGTVLSQPLREFDILHERDICKSP